MLQLEFCLVASFDDFFRLKIFDSSPGGIKMVSLSQSLKMKNVHCFHMMTAAHGFKRKKESGFAGY
jgi:hypothetical protein